MLNKRELTLLNRCLALYSSSGAYPLIFINTSLWRRYRIDVYGCYHSSKVPGYDQRFMDKHFSPDTCANGANPMGPPSHPTAGVGAERFRALLT